MSDDPYKILGLASDATDDEVKTAWRKQIQSVHPDRAQARGPEVSSQAEAAAKRINEAYTEIRRRREAGTPSPRKKRHSSAQGANQVGAPPEPREALRLAKAAVQHAEALVDRWKRHMRSIGSARRMGREAHRTALARSQSVKSAGERLAEAHRNVERSIRTVLETRLLAPTHRAADRALDASLALMEQRSGGQRVSVSGFEHAYQQAVTLLQELRDSLEVDPRLLTEVLSEAREVAQAGAHGVENALREAQRSAAEARSAHSRCRDAKKRAKQAARAYEDAVIDAERAVQRGLVSAATANGLCRAELPGAVAAEVRFVVSRFIEESQQLKNTAERLNAEQSRIEQLNATVSEQLTELTTWSQQTGQLQARVEEESVSLKIGVEQIAGQFDSILPALMAEAETEARARLSEVEAAFERIQNLRRVAG